MYRSTPRSPLVITAFRGLVVAIDAVSGEERWRFDLGGFGAIRLHVDERRVVGLGTKLVVLEYATGRLVCSSAVSGRTLLVEVDRAYVSASGVLTAVDLSSGEILWRNELPGTGYGAAAVGTPTGVVQGDLTET